MRAIEDCLICGSITRPSQIIDHLKTSIARHDIDVNSLSSPGRKKGAVYPNLHICRSILALSHRIPPRSGARLQSERDANEKRWQGWRLNDRASDAPDALCRIGRR